jgi:thiamine-monophosphate kinase
LLDYCTQSGIPIAKIGAVSERKEASVLMTANDQRQIVLEKKGYNHFK